MKPAKPRVYDCGVHEVTTAAKLDRCLGFVHGQPCERPVKQVGGPRK